MHAAVRRADMLRIFRTEEKPSQTGGFSGLGRTRKLLISSDASATQASAWRRRHTRWTLAAWKPLGPLVRSNSTVSPSFRLRYPFSWIAEKCTNTSSPVDRWMNPYPLAPLNHLTVPFSLTTYSFHL